MVGSTGDAERRDEERAARVLVNVAEGTEIPEALLGRGVRAALQHEGARGGEVSITLVGDEEIRRMNREYLDRDEPTDVIAFRLYDAGEPVLGDVYLGLDQAQRQAREEGVPRSQELLRLAIHGTLHVLGHDHPETGPEREASPMYRLQERLVRRVWAEREGSQ